MRYAYGFFALVLALLVALYIRGWTSLRYDENDEEIGKSVVFTRQMVQVSGLNKQLVDQLIVEKYDSMLMEKTRWSVSRAWFPDAKAKDIPCSEVFTVSGVFYVIPHGVLVSTFWEGKNKYYVLRSDNHEKTIVQGSTYEIYSEYSDFVANTRECDAAAE